MTRTIQIYQAIHVEAANHLNVGAPSTNYDAVLGAVIASNVIEEVDQMEIRPATAQEKVDMNGADVVLIIKPLRSGPYTPDPNWITYIIRSEISVPT